MTPEQEKHLKDIIEETSKRINLKYRKGQAEHGGDLKDMQTYKLLDNAIDEAIDQIVYLLTLRNSILDGK